MSIKFKLNGTKRTTISCDGENEEEPTYEVKVIDNNIYFYCPVDNDTILQLTSHIR